MRRTRTLFALSIVATVLAMPAAAAANGGAYLDLDKEHYLPGDQGIATTYVTVPERNESIFDEGPFYLFVLPEGMTLREDRPIPGEAVPIGTFSIEEEKQQYELSASFTVPALAGDFYSLDVCNDPCTVSGFREPLGGWISIVATQREAQLLNRNSRLYNRMYGLRSDLRRAERRLQAARENFGFELANGEADRAELAAEIERLERQLSAARSRAAAAAGSTADPWVIGGIFVAVLLATALTFRRSRSAGRVRPASLPLEMGNG